MNMKLSWSALFIACSIFLPHIRCTKPPLPEPILRPQSTVPLPEPTPRNNQNNFLPEAFGLPTESKRPLPKQENELVQNLIKELLDSNADVTTIKLKELGSSRNSPLLLINSTKFWSLENILKPGSIEDSEKAKVWVADYLRESQIIFTTAAKAGWNYFTNITEPNHGNLADSEEVLSKFLTVTAKQAQQFNVGSLQSNETLSRIIQMLALEGMTALPVEDFEMFSDAQRHLANMFSNGAVCDKGRPPPCTLRYPELQHVMGTSHRPPQLLYIWLAWRRAVGPQMKPVYLDLIELSNAGAKANGYPDAGALWRSPYEETSPENVANKSFDLEKELVRLWEQMQPFYKQLHAFVRRQLNVLFPPGSATNLTQDGPIPAHLLGTLNSNTWISLFGVTVPFAADHTSVGAWTTGAGDEVTPQLIRRNYTVTQMFMSVDKLYTSLGFSPLSPNVWNESILTRPRNSDMLCDPPAAFDFRDSRTYRLKACAQVNYADFIEAHRLLGNIHYQQQYAHLPLPFREGANPSFPQAVADAFGLLARSSTYLQSLKLQRRSEPMDGKGADPKIINKLYQEALEQVSHLPFSLVVDIWRWKLLDGRLNEDDMNDGWWTLRKDYQGIMPPVERTQEDFDPVSSPLVSQQHYPSTRRFISYILQFQILKALCNTASGSPMKKPLDVDACNLMDAKEAGKKLKALMSLGASKPWPEVLQLITGSQSLDATALLDYFKPLHDWLITENERTGTYIGWDGPGTPFPVPEQKIFRGRNNKADTGLGGGLADHLFNGAAGETFAPPRDKVAFPGEDCSGGQVCLQQSECIDNKCQCPGDNVQWHGHCLPNDPTLVGFGHAGSTGFKLDIIEEGTEPEPEPESESESHPPQVTKTSNSSEAEPSGVYHYSCNLLLIVVGLFVLNLTGAHCS